MQELAARADFSAALSVPTLDERAWRATEPHTPHPRARLEAVAELNRAGIRTGILVAPLMPGINDAPEQVERILELATEAGAAYVSGIALHLRARCGTARWSGWPSTVPTCCRAIVTSPPPRRLRAAAGAQALGRTHREARTWRPQSGVEPPPSRPLSRRLRRASQGRNRYSRSAPRRHCR